MEKKNNSMNYAISSLATHNDHEEYITVTDLTKATGKLFDLNSSHMLHERYGMNEVKAVTTTNKYNTLTTEVSAEMFDILESTCLKIKFKALPKGYHYINNLYYKLLKCVTIYFGGSGLNTLGALDMYIKDVAANKVPKHSKNMFVSKNIDDLLEWSSKDFTMYIPISPVDMCGKNNIIPLYTFKHHMIKYTIQFSSIKLFVNTLNEPDAPEEDITTIIEKDIFFNGIILHPDIKKQYIESIEKKMTMTMVRALRTCGREEIPINRETYKHRTCISRPVESMYFCLTTENNDLYTGLEFDIQIETCFDYKKDRDSNIMHKFRQDSGYFNTYLPRKHLGLNDGLPDGVYYYSNSMTGDQPNVTVDYSRIDYTIIELIFREPTDNKHGPLYFSLLSNELEVMQAISGMVGIMFSK